MILVLILFLLHLTSQGIFQFLQYFNILKIIAYPLLSLCIFMYVFYNFLLLLLFIIIQIGFIYKFIDLFIGRGGF